MPSAATSDQQPRSSSAMDAATKASVSAKSGPVSPTGSPAFARADLLHLGRTSRKGRKASPFKARSSRLDLETLDREQDVFRGFFTLFWIGMAFYVAVTAFNNKADGRPIWGRRLLNLFSQDVLVMAISDLVMILATFVAPIIQKLVIYRVVGRPFTLVFQHMYQGLFLATAIWWALWRDWPWTASAFFVLHTLAMLMKLHSYITTNADLELKTGLMADVKAALASVKGTTKDTKKSSSSSSSSTAMSATSIRKLLSRHGLELRHRPSVAMSTVHEGDNAEEDAEEKNESLETDRIIHALESELESLKEDLCVGLTRYPDNVTFANYIDYLSVPTLVYELEYPRTERVRKHYLLQKFAATAACFVILYNTVEHYIIPVLEATPRITFAHSLVSLMFPFMICYLLVFYIIFEAICGFFAEITRFADRNFYDDWWNSVSFDEFARKWNKPVHVFLLRHVYYDSMEHYSISRSTATYLTFLLSSAVHELVLAVVGRRVRFYLFLMQMFQLPLIWMSRIAAFREHKWAGNAFFWFGMFAGPPLLASLYCREAWLE